MTERHEHCFVMHVHRLLVVVTWLALVAPAQPVEAQIDVSIVRCGAGVVRIGDSTARVLDACGTPTERQSRTVAAGRGWVTVDVWRFDLGPGVAIEEMWFWNDAVWRIETIPRSAVSRPVRIPPP